ncbi:MAG: glycosyltransferase family 39 protein [Halobacteria archaeon]
MSVVVAPDGPVDRIYFHVGTPEVLAAKAICEDSGGAPIRDANRLSKASFNSWIYLDLPCQGRIRLLLTSDAHIGEVYLFRGFEKRVLNGIETNYGDPSRLFDEQTLLNEPPNYFYGAIYDEIIYVRTAREYLTQSAPFVHFDHPPLGKDIIALGVGLAGMSPLGWRLPQLASGVLVLIVVYLIGSHLAGARTGLLATLLLALNPLHYTYSRLGLLDVHLVLFGSLSALFFLRAERRLFLVLSLSMLGAAAAVKWTALLLFPALLLLLLIRRPRVDVRKYGPAVLGGILTAGVIYLGSYAPYYAAGFGLGDVLAEQCCGPRSIFSYHSTIFTFNLQDGWNSPWWSWPLSPWVPSPYSTLAVGGAVSGVTAIGNPLLAWMSLPLMAWALWTGIPFLRRKSASDSTPKETWTLLVLSVFFFAAWLPLSIPSRTTYFYHYYLPFVLSLPVLAYWLGKQPVRFRYIFITIAALLFLALLRPALGLWG